VVGSIYNFYNFRSPGDQTRGRAVGSCGRALGDPENRFNLCDQTRGRTEGLCGRALGDPEDRIVFIVCF